MQFCGLTFDYPNMRLDQVQDLVNAYRALEPRNHSHLKIVK
jgi:hypothetical protein